jgi:hypothetical protein
MVGTQFSPSLILHHVSASALLPGLINLHYYCHTWEGIGHALQARERQTDTFI